jgi:spermidine synthase
MALWYDEVHEDKFRFGLKVVRTLFAGQSDFQKVDIIETEGLGKALLLDDLWMTAEGDEKTYHEMIVHAPMTTARNARRVLIIGGGDGGSSREVLRYPEVEHVDMVEIDGMVIEACKQHLPTIGSAWNDERLHVHVGDGVAWVKRTDLEPYDVIIVDGSDPVGPAVGLFNQDFYNACAARLADDGVFVTQGESPRFMTEVHLEMLRAAKEAFGHAWPYYQTVTIYPGGAWSWIYASKTRNPFQIDEGRVAAIEAVTEIYNQDVHRGAFAVPNHIKRRLS